jgi:hypothetical protein
MLAGHGGHAAMGRGAPPWVVKKRIKELKNVARRAAQSLSVLASILAHCASSSTLATYCSLGILNEWHQSLVAMAGSKGDDGASNGAKEGATMVQRVVCEVGRVTVLTKTNYSNWVMLMKVKLKARGLRVTVDKGGINP